MFEGAGFEVVDIGIDIDVQSFVEAVKEHKPDIVGMSALLTTTMPKMGETINALKEAGHPGSGEDYDRRRPGYLSVRG